MIAEEWQICAVEIKGRTKIQNYIVVYNAHMTTKIELETSLKDAMRAGDELRKRTLRMALSSIKQVEIDKNQALDESGIAAILQKEIKSRRESILDAERANRPDLVKAAEAEIAIIEGYLPKALSPEELEQVVKLVITELGAASPKDMGQVMKALLPRVQGRAPGDQVSALVRKLLQG
jgi:uncharacterized protein YqeY